MKRVILMFVTILLCAIQAYAQEGFTVTGVVTSADEDETLIGVAIQQEGTSYGVITDIDGSYSIRISGVQQATLIFSYLGMEEQRHVVNAETGVLNVALKSSTQMVEDVVVVAYGTRKKGTIAGSVSTVKGESIENVPTAGFDQALQGKTPGLQVTAVSGEPSKAASFQIRGTNSINSGTSPLFILDGVPIESSDFNTISPSDIESVTILKDASSTSIYGARAANGVMVITTKRGANAKDKAKITLRTQLGFSNLARTEWNLMNTAERIQFEKEIGLDDNQDYDILSKTDINWLDMVFNDKAFLQSYDLSVARATDKTNFFISGNFFDQEGIAQASTFRRYSLRANTDTKATEKFKIGNNTMLTYEEVQQADDGEYALYTPISASRFMLPYWNPYKEDGSLASDKDGSWAGTGVNPIEWMENNPLKHKKYKLLNVLYAELAPIEGLTIRSQFGVDYVHANADMKSYPSFPQNNNSGTAGKTTNDIMSLNITNTVNYKFYKNQIHSFNFLLGQEGVNYTSEGFQIITAGQNNDYLTNLSNGTRALSWANTHSSYSFLSFFGRAEYNYDFKYYIDFSVRSDASSRFGTKGRWGTFWSVGLMWNMKKEKFMEGADWLNNAQFSFSTGTSGNSSIPNYDHLELVGGGADYNGNPGLATTSQGNENLGWEKLWSSNIAAHFTFLNNINLDVEFYNKLTTNMLMYVPQSYSNNGYGYKWDNIGAMVNRGVEVQLAMNLVKAGDFLWSIDGNFSYNKNKITELYNGLDEYEISNSNVKLVKGHAVSEFYINRYAGVNPINGEPLWYDKNGNITNEYNESDKVMIGKSYIAPWQGGFGTTLSWKGIALNAQFSWVAKRYVLNNDRFFEESNGLYSAYNQSKRLLYDRWKNPGDITDIPKYGYTPEFDSHLLEDASFLRLKNLMISYSLPASVLKKSNFFNTIRVYAQGQNLLTFTKFSGIDPEGVGNTYAAQYPMSRQYSFGLEFGF
ncbi:MAG: TonB-dependent receptor [Bacteroidales bacterium]|nr:TonB-dependent receptor [Bacteroidales bacterium]